MAPIKTFVGKFAKTAFTVAAPSSSSNTNTQQQSTTSTSITTLETMCKLFKATPIDNLYLSTTGDGNGERGVCVTKPMKAGDAIFSIPISSCFRDDEPPRWYERHDTTTNNNKNDGNPVMISSAIDGAQDDEHDITDYERYNPSGWASRLAASYLDMELNSGKGTEIIMDDDLQLGRELWNQMLPDKDMLRASLPVHWGEEVLGTSKCTALELAVDSAYFARASAVADLSVELKEALDECSQDDEQCKAEKDGDDALDIVLDLDVLQRKCHNALDVVQTRACRVERTCEDGVQWGPPLRILAPIFDFINHGSSRTKGEGSANAAFGIENERMCDMHEAKLVVRAAREMLEGEEVLIDYGDSARPAWRCLTSYGFVPEYDINTEVVDDDEHVELQAELWMNGLRFEVDPHSVPFDLVEVAAAQALLDDLPFEDDEHEEEEDENGGGMLTPVVARAIAKRAMEAGFNLITEPDMANEEEDWDDPQFVHSASLAALLRWSQHKVLLAFADNLNMLFPSPSAKKVE